MPDPTIDIRQAVTPADFDAVATLFRAYVANLGFELDFQDFDSEMAAFPEPYTPPAGALLLASVDGAVAGAVAMRPLKDGICEMKRLYVPDTFRGLGLGRRLASAIIAAARADGYRAMRLDTVTGSMAAAVALYRALGFREIPAYTHNPMPSALFMELDLVDR
jgi:ribosomal protein S18 acetylase RimI-like enzyme